MPRSKRVPVEEVISSGASEVQSSADDESGDSGSSVSGTSDSDTEPVARVHPLKKKSTRRKEGAPEQTDEKKPARKHRRASTGEKPARERSKTPSKRSKVERKHAKRPKSKKGSNEQATDAESESEGDTEDEDSYDMTSGLIEKYRNKVRRFIKNDNMFGFVKILRESPLATVLENMHYIFVAAAHNEEMTTELTRVNKGFNIVSKKFIKAVRESEDCRHKYAESERVAESIANNTPLKQIRAISEYTPEFILMKTIQSGDLITCNLMLKKWDIAPLFAASKALVAAFYGWEDFFGNTERFSKSQDLVVHALCGGYKRVLRLVCSGSGSRWVLPETLQKAGLVLPVRADMKKRFKQMMDDGL